MLKKLTIVNDILKGINSREELLKFLNEHPNIYHAFILKKLEEEKTLLPNIVTQKHHIIPKHAGGPDVAWNLIKLTPSDHDKSHELREEVYHDIGDKLAIRFRSKKGITPEEATIMRIKASHESSKQNGTGFNSSAQQSKNGQKGGKKQTSKKIEKYQEKLSPQVKAIMDEGSRWKHKLVPDVVEIPAGSMKLLIDLIPILLHRMPDCPDKENFKAVGQKAAGSLGKVVKRIRNSCYGWELVQ